MGIDYGVSVRAQENYYGDVCDPFRSSEELTALVSRFVSLQVGQPIHIDATISRAVR